MSETTHLPAPSAAWRPKPRARRTSLSTCKKLRARSRGAGEGAKAQPEKETQQDMASKGSVETTTQTTAMKEQMRPGKASSPTNRSGAAS
jgi:hypothetical protein